MTTPRETLPGWNPRFLAFCTTLLMCPDRAQAIPNHEYIGWINRQWGDWRTEHGRHGTPINDADHEAFDLWLWTRVRQGLGRAIKSNRATRDAARYILEIIDPATKRRIADKAKADRIPFSEAFRLLEPDLWREMEVYASAFPDWW